MERVPLHWAAAHGHLESMAALIQAKCDVEVTDKQGQTTLHCAAQNNHHEVLAFMLDSTETVKVNAVDKNGQTALHLAAINNCMEIVEKLLQHRADPNIKDKCGCTALHHASQRGHHLVLVRLLRSNMDTDEPNYKARTALHIAASLGHLEVVETLLRFGASLTVKDKHGNTPLHLAVLGCHSSMTDLLVKKGASVNSTNSVGFGLSSFWGSTPLHMAAELGFTEVVQVLVSHGADLFLPEKGGRTALYIAARGSYTAIVDMLITAEREIKHKTRSKESSVTTLQPGSRQFCNSLVDIKEESVGSDQPQQGAEAEETERQRQQKQQQMQRLAWTLAKELLTPNDWKHLARHWGFTAEHIKAIEHQYTGKSSYKEHGYRMLLIWLHGLPATSNPLKDLFEALVAIDKRDVAEKIRKKAEENAYGPRRFNPGKLCHMCRLL
ncbi:hypothetical protein HPB47_028374 [Ixodes persulcatus]|uniref:Uncharacterized protein n=1 Tax=Ixodes persulcatus TaxID=34615 RepID=A0AC60PTI2_IXOPE|nr:hypothetical protein HPB47_028374 [Ixodes persulcatus]